MSESNLDLSLIFVYQSQAELDEKIRLEGRCRAVEQAAIGGESVVNMIFALQGLNQNFQKLLRTLNVT